MYRRIIIDVPALGSKSAPQDIPRGEGTKGATKDRQFTDQNCKLEKGHSPVLMRKRSCHFCDCCMRLDPMDRANRKAPATDVEYKGPNSCAYSVICGNPDNIVQVPRKQEKGTKNRANPRGDKAREEEADTMVEGEHCAFFVKTECEAWAVGKVVSGAWTQPNSGRAVVGKRGESMEPGVKHFTSANMCGKDAPSGRLESRV